MSLTPFIFLLALAAEVPQTPEACGQINDDAARLACYDSLSHRAPAPAQSAAPAAPAAPVAPAPPASPPPTGSTLTPEERFGAESLNQPPEANAPKVTRIEAHIAGPMNGWKTGTVFTLTNGQEWKVTGDDSAYYPDPVDGPAVVIRRGFFTGSYFMEIAGTGRKVKVRRIR